MDFPMNERNFLGQNWRSSNLLRNVLGDLSFPRDLFPLGIQAMPNFNGPPTPARMNNNRRNTWQYRDTNRRYRTRNLYDMHRTLRRLRNKLHDAYGDLDNARVELQDAREGLEDARNEVMESRNELQNIVDEVDRISVNFQAPSVLTGLSEHERSNLQRDLQTTRRKMEDARRQMRYADDDLDEDDTTEVVDENAVNRQRANERTATTANKNNSGDEAAAPTTSSSLAHDENSNTSLCSVCMEKSVNSVLYKCGHMCLCYQCALKLQRRRDSRHQCPICRAPIRDVIRIYKS